MKRLSVIVLIFLSLCGKSQVQVSQQQVNFGLIGKGDNRVKELTLRNIGEKEESIVRIGASELEFDTKLSNKTIGVGSSIVLRIKYNPRTKGQRSYDIPIYFSKADPVVIKMTADVNYLEWEDYTPCPDFSNQNSKTDFTVVFKVVDSKNGEAIKDAKLLITEQGVEQAEYKTKSKGIIEKVVPLGYYSMTASAKNYSVARKESYINRRNNYFIFALDPIKQELTQQVEEEFEEKEEEIIVDLAEEKVIETTESIPDQSDFSIEKFAANNVVFLIDVSTSMKKDERLEVLKSSMKELLIMLRPQDRLSIITYASSTDVVLNSVAVENKNEISGIIDKLEGKGLTAGSMGIKKAYSIAQKNFIEGGNNQVYLATDGAFNKGDQDMSKYIRRQKKNGIFMSIIAVKSPEWTVSKMKAISKDANGDYIAIEDFDMDKEKLSEMVKKQSKKY